MVATLVVPLWVEATMCGSVLGSGILTWYLAPKMFHNEDGHVDYIAAAIPFFAFLIILEALLLYLSKLQSRGGRFSFADTWSSLAAGTGQRMWIVCIYKVVLKILVPGAAYTWVWNNWALYRCPLESASSWVAAVLLVDFVYYWTHRAGHQVAFLWAGHSVHHSSEHYNLSTALRQSLWQHVYEGFFIVISALFFPPSLYATCAAWNTIYQFWIHTCCIRRLGPLELLIMTPSHHRVHHDRRVHKNFGGLLIIWDRMFGSFLDEALHAPDSSDTEVCAFGTIVPPDTWSDCVVQTHVWRQIVGAGLRRLRAGDVRGALASLVVGPGYYTTTKARTLVPVAPDRRLRLLCYPTLLLRVYIVAHFALLMPGALVLLTLTEPVLAALVYGPAIVASLALQGFMLDGRRWAVYAEAARCAVFALALSRAELLPLLSSIPTAGASILAAIYASSALLCLRLPNALASSLVPSARKTT